MLYVEQRLKPSKAPSLYKHIQHCEPCRQLFLAMTDFCADDFEHQHELEAAPEGFVEAVMAKIAALPIEQPTAKEAAATNPKTNAKDWLRLASGIYALLLAIGLGFIYNTELYELPAINISNLDWADAFFGSLAQAGEAAALNTAGMAGSLTYYILAIAVVLSLTFVFLVQRENKKYE